MHLTHAEIAAAKPTDRTAVRKTAEAAIAAFEGQLIDCGQFHTVAVGAAQLAVDDTDNEWLLLSATYDHANEAHGPAKNAILSALGGMLHHDRIGAVGCYFEPTGGRTNGVEFEFHWRVRVAAA